MCAFSAVAPSCFPLWDLLDTFWLLSACVFSQTLPDYVIKTSIIKWDGTQVNLCRSEDPTGFAVCVPSFGLLGVNVGECCTKRQ